MATQDFQIDGRNFKISKINAMKQYHIVRRIGPILSDLLSSIKSIPKQDAQMTEEQRFDEVAKIAGPIMSGLSKLSDKDAELVLLGLLSAVEINRDGVWGRVVMNDQLMYQDLELPVMLNAAGRSLMFNMAGFFDILQRGS